MSEILNQFPDDELPVSTVDVRRAIQAGRRRRVRTGLATAGTVVAVVAAGATAPVWLSPQPSPSPLVPAPTCADSQPSRSPSPTWEYFDPLTYEIDTSGVTGYSVGITMTSTYFQQAFLSGDDTTVDVMLYAAGGDPQSFLDEPTSIDPATGIPADPVNGVPAYWVPATNAVALAWQWAEGAWAIVRPISTPGRDQDDLRTIAMQVAQAVSFGAGTPVTSPFSLPLPDCLYPALTLTFDGSGDSGQAPVNGFHLGFDPPGAPAPTHGFGYVPHLWVNAYTYGTVDDLPASATEYPEDLGYPAYQVDLRPEEGRDSHVLWVYDVLGFVVEIEPVGVSGPPAQRLAYAADVFRTLTIYPGAATDLSAWGDPITP